MPDETDGEDVVDGWGVVNDGNIDMGRFVRLLVTGALTTVTLGIVNAWVLFRDRFLEYFATVETAIVDLVETYLGIPVEVLEAARIETTSSFYVFGVAAYPLATVIVFASIVIVYWGVRWYV